MKKNIKNLTFIALSLVFFASCAVSKKSKKSKDVCAQTGASSLDLEITGFVEINPNTQTDPFPGTASQVQLTDTTGNNKVFTLSNHIALLFQAEVEPMKAMKKIIPVASLCCSYDQTKGYFLTEGRTRSVIWAYGKQPEDLPPRYKKYLSEKGKDGRKMVYANYSRHIIWPVKIPAGEGFTSGFQMLVQEKDGGVVTSRLVFVVGMDYSQIKSLISNNTQGIVFEISDVAFDNITGEWKTQDKVNDKNKVIYTFAWNAEEGKIIFNPFK